MIISGTNFTGATSVTFNGVSASFTVTSATAIQATVPAGASAGPLSVATRGGTATSTSNFTVTVKVTLNAAKAGNGSGTLTSSSSPASPTQINCGATCSASYDSARRIESVDLGDLNRFKKKRVWRFPSGAQIHFGHLEHAGDVRAHQSAEYQYIAFDELTHFLEQQ